MLESVFAEYESVSLSQKIDQWQSKVGDCQQVADRIQQYFSVTVSLSTDLDSLDAPEPENRVFVLHTVGSFDRMLWQEIVRFGMFNLPNIAYRLDGLQNGWLNKRLEINRSVVRWFDLKTSDSEFAKLLKMTSPIFLTIDGHLCFCFSENEGADRFLKVISVLGEKYSLKPTIEERQNASVKVG